MTQQQLAAASGSHHSEISRIESGNGNSTVKTLGLSPTPSRLI
jgi:transcriptional regulator with XRE-family HTH domain